MYDDQYSSCSGTYVTLRIYHDEKHPDELTTALGIVPTDTQVKGELTGKRQIAVNGWFLSTEHKVDSKDSRRHIDELLNLIMPPPDTGLPPASLCFHCRPMSAGLKHWF